MISKQTPSQTIGPFFAYGLTAAQYGYEFTQITGGNLLEHAPETDGECIRIVGRILDGNGDPVPDAMVEIWQADAQGRYTNAQDAPATNTGFSGFGRVGTGTDPENRFVFETIKPGSIEENQAPHITVTVFARGLLSHLFTRIYFSDEPSNREDPVLTNLPEDRRQTLIARRETDDQGPLYRFDIHLQGDNETVFFDI